MPVSLCIAGIIELGQLQVAYR